MRQFKTKISIYFGGAVSCQLPDSGNQQYTNNKLAYKNLIFFQYELSFDSSIIAEAIITSFPAFGPRTQNTKHAETALTSHTSMICIEYHKCSRKRDPQRGLLEPLEPRPTPSQYVHNLWNRYRKTISEFSVITNITKSILELKRL